MQKLHAHEKSGSQFMAKMVLAKEISVFFNHKYFINGLTSDFDFLDVDMHEWKEGLLIGFWKNFFSICPEDFFKILCNERGQEVKLH